MPAPKPDRGKSHAKKPARGYRYNPYEFAVCGRPGVGKTTLISRLVAALPEGLQAMTVTYDGSLDDPLAPYAWLAADAVFVEGHASDDLPRLLLLDDRLASLEDPAFRPSPPAAVVHPFAPGSLEERRARNAVQSTFGSLPWFHRDDLSGIRTFVLDQWTRRRPPLAGLLLTGGRSSRMGQDKALLDYHGRSQVEHTMAMLARHCQGAFLSCRPDQTDDPHRARFPLLPDRFLGMGPAGGILSALGNSDRPGHAWLVLACDLPRVTDELLAALVAARNPFRFATAFRGTDGFPEPLCAIWEPKAYSRLLQFAGLAHECPRKLLIHSPACLLPPPAENALDNGNSPADVERIRHDLHGRS